MIAIESFVYQVGLQLEALASTAFWRSENQTERITATVIKAAVHVGARIELECRIGLTRGGFRKTGRPYSKNGHIDARVIFDDGIRLAIEIDRANKRWSLAKLNYCVEQEGWAALWIRWKGRPTEAVPPGVMVMDLGQRRLRFLGSTSIGPNQTLEPTTLAVTPRACARVAPSSVVAHL